MVNQKELAALLGLTTRQVNNLVEKGMPVVSENGKRLYDAPRCIAWYREAKVAEAVRANAPADLEEAKARKMSAEAELAEMQRDLERGRLMPVVDAEKAVGEIVGMVRAKLMAMPGKIGPLMVGCRTIAESTGRLEPAVHDVLLELAHMGG